MREIKFRAWHKHAKEMFVDCKTSEIFTWQEQGQPLEIKQYTGLTDKKGVEIYEGDIVNLSSITSKVVEKYNGAFGYWGSGGKKFDDFISFAQNHYFKFKDGKSERIEVIGNIHENPELLEN